MRKPETDPECLKGPIDGVKEDPANLRDTRGKQQYGIDFNYPVERYIEGFTNPT